MKLYLMQNGFYTQRANPPVDPWDRPVWTEVTITFSDDGAHVRLRPVQLEAGPVQPQLDVVTLSLLESKIFRLQSMPSQALLQAWFMLRVPDRRLRNDIDYCDFDGGKLSYMEWGGRKLADGHAQYGNEETEPGEHIPDSIIVATLRAQGLLP